MNIKIKSIIIIVLLMSQLSSCKKYEEGPAFSLVSPVTRVLGIFYVDRILIDDQVVFSGETPQIEFEFFKSSTEGGVKYYVINIDQNQVYFSTWEFESGRNYLIMNKTSYSHLTDSVLFSPFMVGQREFLIKRLTQKECFFEQITQGKLYRYELKRDE